MQGVQVGLDARFRRNAAERPGSPTGQQTQDVNMKPDQAETPGPGSVQPAGSGPGGFMKKLLYEAMAPALLPLRKDKQRLNWLERSHASITYFDDLPIDGVPQREPFWEVGEPYAGYTGHTLREAIDQAMDSTNKEVSDAGPLTPELKPKRETGIR